jgi:hypothetical protein
MPKQIGVVQGVLTPFDRLEGFERKQKDGGEDLNNAGARTAGETSTSGKALEISRRHTYHQILSSSHIDRLLVSCQCLL